MGSPSEGLPGCGGADELDPLAGAEGGDPRRDHGADGAQVPKDQVPQLTWRQALLPVGRERCPGQGVARNFVEPLPFATCAPVFWVVRGSCLQLAHNNNLGQLVNWSMCQLFKARQGLNRHTTQQATCKAY